MGGSSKSSLRQLGEIILNSIDTIEERLASDSLDLPSLDDPFDPTAKVETVLQEPDMVAATAFIVAAAAQLIKSIRNPVQAVLSDALSVRL